MKTLKKLWNKITMKAAKTKIAYERFIEIIKARLSMTSPNNRNAKFLYSFAIVLATAMSIVTLMLTPINPVAAFMIAKLPFYNWLSWSLVFFSFTLPIDLFIATVWMKITTLVLSPWKTHEFKPIKDLINYPVEMIDTILVASTAAAGVAGVMLIILRGALIKLLLLVETVVKLPANLYVTHSFDGFNTDMKTWFVSWTPKYFFEDTSIGDLIVKRFRDEEEKAKTAPTKSAPTKMGPVTI